MDGHTQILTCFLAPLLIITSERGRAFFHDFSWVMYMPMKYENNSVDGRVTGSKSQNSMDSQFCPKLRLLFCENGHVTLEVF